MNLPVMYVHDTETGGWGFRVPSPDIVGGAEMREEADEHARTAVLFTLDSADTDLLLGEDVGYLQVTVERKADR